MDFITSFKEKMDKIEEGTKEMIGGLYFETFFFSLTFELAGNFLHMFGVDSTIEEIWNSSR